MVSREERIAVKIPVYCDEKDQILETQNISLKGCFIETDDPLPEGTKVHLVFYSQKNKMPILVKGIVKYSFREKKGNIGPGMGVSFTEVPNEYIKMVKYYRKRKSPWHWFYKFDTFSNVFKNIFFIFFMVVFLLGTASEKIRNYRIDRTIHTLEKNTGQKIITMIHREVSVGLFGIPVKRYIKIEDAEKVLNEIRKTPPDKPIGLVLHTPGGILFSAFQIAKALKEHKGNVTVYIPHYAMSGGTLIALAADRIVMDKNAILGPVDPQMVDGKKTIPAVAVKSLPKYKSFQEMEDETLILYDQAQKAVKQVKQMVAYLLSCKSLNDKRCERIFTTLVDGTVTHDYPITYEKAKKLGLPVDTDMPKEVYSLFLIK